MNAPFSDSAQSTTQSTDRTRTHTQRHTHIQLSSSTHSTHTAAQQHTHTHIHQQACRRARWRSRTSACETSPSAARGRTSRRRDCHSAATPSTLSRRFNADKKCNHCVTSPIGQGALDRYADAEMADWYVFRLEVVSPHRISSTLQAGGPAAPFYARHRLPPLACELLGARGQQRHT